MTQLVSSVVCTQGAESQNRKALDSNPAIIKPKCAIVFLNINLLEKVYHYGFCCREISVLVLLFYFFLAILNAIEAVLGHLTYRLFRRSLRWSVVGNIFGGALFKNWNIIVSLNVLGKIPEFNLCWNRI